VALDLLVQPGLLDGDGQLVGHLAGYILALSRRRTEIRCSQAKVDGSDQFALEQERHSDE
jgi:hypothetical protein